MKQVLLRCGTFLICVLIVSFGSPWETTAGEIHIGWGSDSKDSRAVCPKKVRKGGPPPHAPAHGYRAKYAYRYYPSSSVYYDTGRKVYFYLEGDDWRASVSLPQHLNLRLDNYVTVDMDTDKPYTRFKKHRHKYPPGQLKKKNKNWARY
jgi:hypothetical protein